MGAVEDRICEPFADCLSKRVARLAYRTHSYLRLVPADSAVSKRKRCKTGAGRAHTRRHLLGQLPGTQFFADDGLYVCFGYGVFGDNGFLE